MQASMTRGGDARGGRLHADQRRQCGLRARLGLACVAVAVLISVLGPGLATQADAQTGGGSGREILLGTIETREPRVPRDHDRGEVAARLLDDAMQALDGGEVMFGRRQLEVLVQYYPETLAADAARRELGRFDVDRRAATSRYADPRDARWSARTGREATPGSDRFGYSAPRESQPPEVLPRTAPSREPSPNIVPLPIVPSPIVSSPGVVAPANVAAPGTDSQNRRQRLQDERRIQSLARDFQATAGDRVFFGETDADLGSRARVVLVAQARWLAAHPELPINIEAHADDQGSPAYNSGVAERRGRAVRDRLIAEGVAASRITVRAYGRDRPVATCPAPECAAQNRRVVTHIGDLPPEGAENRSDETRSPTVAGRSGP